MTDKSNIKPWWLPSNEAYRKRYNISKPKEKMPTLVKKQGSALMPKAKITSIHEKKETNYCKHTISQKEKQDKRYDLIARIVGSLLGSLVISAPILLIFDFVSGKSSGKLVLLIWAIVFIIIFLLWNTRWNNPE